MEEEAMYKNWGVPVTAYTQWLEGTRSFLPSQKASTVPVEYLSSLDYPELLNITGKKSQEQKEQC